MKAFSKLISTIPIVIALTLLPSTQANARYGITWKAVPGTAIPNNMNPTPQPAYIGTNTKIRRGEMVVFDAYVDGQYVLYAGNCNKKTLYRLAIGSFDNQRQPRKIRPYPNEKWFQASKFQTKVLKAACSL